VWHASYSAGPSPRNGGTEVKWLGGGRRELPGQRNRKSEGTRRSRLRLVVRQQVAQAQPHRA